MADTKITALAAITTVDPAADVLPIVDVSDTSMAASGTTKKITSNQILGAGGTATLASATITGDLTVRTNKLAVTSSGVGFGTASPSAPIQVGDTTGSPEIRLSGASTAAAGPYLTFYKGGTRKTLIGNEAVLIGSGTSDALMFYTEGGNGIKWNIGSSTPSMTLDSSGNVGIGVTPSAWATTFNVKAFQTAGGSLFNFSNTLISLTQNSFYNTSGGYSYANNGFASEYYQMDGKHIWRTAASGTAGNAVTFTQAMTLDASGNLLVGDTAQSSNERLRVNNTASNGWAVTMTSTTRGWLNRQSDANGGIAAYFEVGSGNTNVGSINTTSSGTSFVTTSDYRLKENVQPLVGGLARISALKPSIYKWKIDGSNGEGFLAHELAEVVPAAVTGVKDAVNEDGSIKAQGVDLSKVVPVLVAAIQELAAEVNALKNA